MKVFCLGGAGKICGEAVRDLVEFSEFERITIGDYNEEAGRALMEELNDSRVDFRKVNVLEKDETIDTLRGYDVVMDGTTIKLNDRTTECIARAGCSGINLNGFGEE
ncbi:MAG TPA: saccharopine dehydrogenase NADP-binding domain-containing protein, partial [Syntrophales bacterium]|nr:saccharopine dehydrogenase NADP-binding domain-containing protein [Syntrophales bacterium]